jgi:hypothetical protein
MKEKGKITKIDVLCSLHNAFFLSLPVAYLQILFCPSWRSLLPGERGGWGRGGRKTHSGAGPKISALYIIQYIHYIIETVEERGRLFCWTKNLVFRFRLTRFPIFESILISDYQYLLQNISGTNYVREL